MAAFALPLYDVAAGWATHADYSYGFLVPAFSGWWLWSRRANMPHFHRWPKAEGLPFILFGSILLALGTFNIAKEALQGAGFILALAGVVLMFLGGWRGLRWAWPALAFLAFMYPLPNRIETTVAWELRRLAAILSNLCLQAFGFPSFIEGEGTVITVNNQRLDVEHACSGLGMLLAFCALCAAAAMTVKRPRGDRILILVSAVPIAVLSNVVRITAIGVVYANGWPWLGSVIVHDLAGWLMMPVALGFIWLELKVFDWVFPKPERGKSHEVLHKGYQSFAQDLASRSGRHPVPAAPEGPAPTGSLGATDDSGRPDATSTTPRPDGMRVGGPTAP
jgi:exosortase